MHQQPDSRNQVSLSRTGALLQQHKDQLARNTSRIFVVLMLLQWVGAVLTATIISPKTWIGTTSSVHVHVWAAVFLGAIITFVPVGLALVYPTRALTRHVIAAGQMLMSALLIHITGGRVETHFHVFGSLAILAFYRDWRILITASIVVYIDHLLRGYYWPQSVYGVLNASPWRAVEHAWWVGFEVAFLCIAIWQSIREMEAIAERQIKLESVNSKIEAEVKERTSELCSINKQMETFCYSMSHDLKAPLRGIQSFSQILIEDHGQQLGEKAKDCVARIQDSATRMNRLVNDLLEYSRVSTGSLPVTPVDLTRATEEAIRLLSAEVQERASSINVQPDLGVALGHDATVVQVMLNLLSNALRYAKLGTAPVVNIRSECRNGRIRVEVQDNGIGIAPQYHQRIFEIFERIPGANTPCGTGVGLAIVAKAIERLGGKLGVESIPASGSTFWFELPSVASIAASRRSKAPSALMLDA